jgi:hypothetical protein
MKASILFCVFVLSFNILQAATFLQDSIYKSPRAETFALRFGLLSNQTLQAVGVKS